MIKLEEELAFYEERNLIHHQGMRTITQKLFQDISRRCNFRKMFDVCLEVLSKINSKESITCSLKPLHEICPSIDEKPTDKITGVDLRAMLLAENIQEGIFRLFSNLQRLKQFRVEQEQKIATVTSERDSAIEKNMSLQEELYNLSTSHAAMDQALKASMVDKLQHLKIEGLQESLFESSIQNGVLKLCDQLIRLSQKCDLQEKKIAAISEERDIIGQSRDSMVIETGNLSKTYESEKQFSDYSKIDIMSEEIKNLHLELEKERSRECHNYCINHCLREENGANEIEINSLEDELFTERFLNKEETSRMEILHLEKSNSENLSATRLCCLDKKTQILLEKSHSFQEHLEKRADDLLMIVDNFLDKFNAPSFEHTDLEENTVVEENSTLVNNGSSEDLNNNEILTSDLFLDKTSPEEVHLETPPGSFPENAESSPGFKETGEVTENFREEELVMLIKRLRLC
nr:uncharacterized protein LOC107457388 isoform X2 [Parasteatoda tepidariorum]